MIEIDFGGRLIGEGHPAFVIAEAGVNHNGDLALGRSLIQEAKGAGADAIKFQSYKAGKISTKTAPRYWVEQDDPDGSQYDTFAKLDSFGPVEHEALFRYARECKLLCFSAPFDDEAVDMLDELGVPGFKIASADLTDHPLLEKVAAKGKPVILSTGLATIPEIGDAVAVVREQGNDQIILLHCTLQYPCNAENANLRMMLHMKAAFPGDSRGLVGPHFRDRGAPGRGCSRGRRRREALHRRQDATGKSGPPPFRGPSRLETDDGRYSHDREGDGAL